MGAWKSCNVCHFYPRSPCGERPHPIGVFVGVVKFLSTLSLRRATHQSKYHYQGRQFLSTLSLRRATDDLEPSSTRKLTFLSTLSLRRATPYVYILVNTFLFLSTLSLRRATRESTGIKPIFRISIHALLAESDY